MLYRLKINQSGVLLQTPGGALVRTPLTLHINNRHDLNYWKMMLTSKCMVGYELTELSEKEIKEYEALIKNKKKVNQKDLKSESTDGNQISLNNAINARGI